LDDDKKARRMVRKYSSPVCRSRPNSKTFGKKKLQNRASFQEIEAYEKERKALAIA